MAGTSGAFVLRTSADFGGLPQNASRFDKVLAAEMRGALGESGKQIVSVVRDRIRSGTYVTNVGTREAIAQGVRAETVPGGVRIVATADALPDDRKLMVAAWQKTSFKHPVFGDKGVIVDQPGRPYFFKTVDEKQPRVTARVERGMQRAADSL